MTGDDKNHQALLKVCHDSLTAGHPGMTKTLLAIAQEYWWPDLRKFVQEYVKGCSECQESKTNTHPNQLPLQPIAPDPNTRPFSTIAIDFVVKLPVSKGYDSICMIMDHDCTKAIILLPCQEEMNSLDVTRLYLECVFPFVGLPDKIISDRDLKFTSKVFKEVCELLEIKQKMASAYHPQTDGQSKKTNQHVETALRIFGNFCQDSWSDLLPIVQYQINSQISSATKQTPYETWMGFIPRSHQPLRNSPVPSLEEHKSQLREAWQLAVKAMTHAQSLWKSSTSF